MQEMPSRSHSNRHLIAYLHSGPPSLSSAFTPSLTHPLRPSDRRTCNERRRFSPSLPPNAPSDLARYRTRRARIAPLSLRPSSFLACAFPPSPFLSFLLSGMRFLLPPPSFAQTHSLTHPLVCTAASFVPSSVFPFRSAIHLAAARGGF